MFFHSERKAYLGKGRLPRKELSATYPTNVERQRSSSDGKLKAASRFREGSSSTAEGQYIVNGFNVNLPPGELQHMANNKSKHQYENRSLGTSCASSVVPESDIEDFFDVNVDVGDGTSSGG